MMCNNEKWHEEKVLKRLLQFVEYFVQKSLLVRMILHSLKILNASWAPSMNFHLHHPRRWQQIFIKNVLVHFSIHPSCNYLKCPSAVHWKTVPRHDVPAPNLTVGMVFLGWGCLTSIHGVYYGYYGGMYAHLEEGSMSPSVAPQSLWTEELF